MVAGCLGSDDDGRDDPSLPNEDDPDGDTANGESPDNDGIGGDGLEEGFTPGVEDDGLDALAEDVYFADVVSYEPSFVADLSLLSPERAEGYQKVHGENFHIYIDASQEIEMYGVDGDLYTVVMGHCDLERRDPAEATYVPVDPSRDDEYASLPAAGTTTIRGAEVYVFEHHVTVEYLSTSTGYPVRSEWPNGRADFHSWGEVDPISPPDMPCEGE